MSSAELDAASAEDRIRRRILWALPSGLYIVGSRSGDRRNGMTLNRAMQVSNDPRILAISVINVAVTTELIQQSGAFSLNILAREDSTMVRKFVKPVDVDLAAQTLNGYPYRDGQTGSPILAAAFAYVDCQIVKSEVVGDHTLFLGQVVDAAFIKPEDTAVLRMEDTRMKYGG